MLGWLFLVLHVFRPLDFDLAPPAEAVSYGRLVYGTKEPRDRVLQGSRITVARWYDGRVHQEADQVTWVSPEAVAGWYGWLADSQPLTPVALKEKWRAAQASLHGKLTFIVRLCAFPRLDPFEMEIGQDANAEKVKNVTFQLSYRPRLKQHYEHKLPEQDGEFTLQSDGSYKATTKGVLENFIEKHEPGEILGQPFFHLSSLASLFNDAATTDTPDDGIPLGGNYAAYYLVTFKIPATLALCPSMKFEIIRPHRSVAAEYDLIRVPEPKPDKTPRHRMRI